ncbi:MAG: GntR family transcriptional regulator [Spirochaetes bacterium]|nr:GntR family transcriptional regulator [Spirochaetota bacterium]
MSILKDVPDLHAKPMREIIYDHLWKAIAYGELVADASFTDQEIADEFGVSRTPAREALQMLESNGYIERIPMKGNKVRSLSPLELAHTFVIRKALETLAVKYSALRITDAELSELGAVLDRLEAARDSLSGEKLLDELFPLIKRFNEIAFESCGSQRIIENIWRQRQILDRYRVMRLVLPNHVQKSIARRRRLFEAFRAHDPEAASAVWTEHLTESFAIWREQSGFADQLRDFMFF